MKYFYELLLVAVVTMTDVSLELGESILATRMLKIKYWYIFNCELSIPNGDNSNVYTATNDLPYFKDVYHKPLWLVGYGNCFLFLIFLLMYEESNDECNSQYKQEIQTGHLHHFKSLNYHFLIIEKCLPSTNQRQITGFFFIKSIIIIYSEDVSN
jgi:hypothetical protein